MVKLGGECKLVFLGDQAVGKPASSLVSRRVNSTPIMRARIKKWQATIGVDFVKKRMLYEDTSFPLLMWDVGGQEKFQSLVPNFIRVTAVAVIVYDVSDKQSFLNSSKRIAEVRAERDSDVIIVLVGNKTDLVNTRQVSTEEGDDKAREFGASFVETSAKDGFNIKPLFSKISSALQGNEAVSCTKQEDLVDLKLKPLTKSSQAEHQPPESSCSKMTL